MKQQEGVDFFLKFTNVKCNKVVIENPVGIMSSKYRKPDQIIQPWMFGHMETKATCLWLKNLPSLIETHNVKEQMKFLSKFQEKLKMQQSKQASILHQNQLLLIL